MEGFRVPIHRSLTQPILLGGAPRDFATLNGTLTACFVLGMHSWAGLLLGIGLQAVAVQLAKSDPEFLATFKRCVKFKRYYE